jgi:hypothetical protein
MAIDSEEFGICVEGITVSVGVEYEGEWLSYRRVYKIFPVSLLEACLRFNWQLMVPGTDALRRYSFN